MRATLAARMSVLHQLCDAEAEARTDVEDGFDPETIQEQWAWVADTLEDPVLAELILIHMINAGWARGRSVLAPSGPRHLAGAYLEFGGLTQLGREAAVTDGWVPAESVPSTKRS